MWGPESLLAEHLMKLRLEELNHAAAARRLLLETAELPKENKPGLGRRWLFRVGRFLVAIGQRLEGYALVHRQEEVSNSY